MKYKEIQVVKIGSQALFRDDEKLDFNRIDDLCLSLRKLRDEKGIMSVVITSGAVALGKQLVDLRHVKNLILRDQLYASVGQPELMRLYSITLNEKVSQMLPTHSVLNNPSHHNKIKEMILGLINAGTFPIINYNDSVDDNEMMQVSTYSDNDKVAEEITSIIKAKRLVILTTVDGVIDENGNLVTIVETKNIDHIKKCCTGKNDKGTGGMKSKVEAAESLSLKGIETIIGNAKYSVESLLNGKDGQGKPVPRTVFKSV